MATPENTVAARKQARQALLRRIRKQRAIVAKRLTAKLAVKKRARIPICR